MNNGNSISDPSVASLDDMVPKNAPGSDADSPWAMPRSAWVRVIKRVWVMTGFHELGLLSAGLAFYTFLAITPLIAATVMVYGLIADVDTVQKQMAAIVDVVPDEVARLLEEQLLQIISTNSGVTGFALVIALFFAIFGGMRAAGGMISALNIINEERETRSFLNATLRTIGLTVATILIALTGIVSGGVFAWLRMHTSAYVSEYFGGSLTLLFQYVTWAFAIALGTSGFALIMRYGPDRRPAKWRWLAPGALLATLLWLAVSFGFSFYVAYISDYNATYGSLSAIVVFLMWLFLSAYGVLLGALLNAEIERQTFCDSTVGPDRPAGERGAVLADVVDDTLPSTDLLEKRKRRRAAAERRRADQSQTAQISEDGEDEDEPDTTAKTMDDTGQ